MTFSERAMFREPRNARSIHAIAFMERFRHWRNLKIIQVMETTKRHINSKGGRPPKEIKRNKTITVHCSAFEQRLLKEKGKEAGITVSEYLREIGLIGKIDRPKREFPKDALLLKGTLNHIAANLNQIAKKRNSGENLGAYMREQLEELSEQLHALSLTIRNYFS